MRAGFSKVEITPPLGVELTGYGYYLERKGTHVIDPLYAHALALENDAGEQYMLISCDLLGLNRYIVADVHAHLEKVHSLPNTHVMVVSIHTHTGPSTKYHEGCGEVCPDYVQTVAPRIIQACDLALKNLDDVCQLQFSMAPISAPFAYNRTAADGPLDQQVRGFFLHRTHHQPIALLSYACHAVSRGHISGISADHPGQAVRIMEEQGFEAMYLNGLCGDIDPIVPDAEKADEQLLCFAQTICQCARQHLLDLPLDVSGGWLQDALRLMPVTQAAIHAAADRSAGNPNMIPGADKVARIWEKEMIAKFDTLTDSEPIHVAYLRLGGIPIIALPFEGFTQTGMLIREYLGDPRALTLGCAEELLGYLPTRDDIARGAYAALESTFLYKRLPALEGEAERLGETLGKLLKNT